MGDKVFLNKVFLVTGGGGDIGKATALWFAARGAKIAAVDMRKESVDATVAEVRKKGGEAEGYTCNVTSEIEIAEIVVQVLDRFGGIDFLFNNAGYQGVFMPVHEYPVEDFRKVMETNVTGAFIVLKAVAQQMVKQKYGRIVNMASRAGTFGPPNMGAYAASKAGLIGLTKTAARDLAPYNIRVNSIGPALLGPGVLWDRQVELQAGTGTQYFSSDPAAVAEQMLRGVPMRRLGGLEEVASVVSFLMSDDSSYMTGVHLPIGGGLN